MIKRILTILMVCMLAAIAPACGVAQGTGEESREPLTAEVIAAAFDGDVKLKDENTVVVLEDCTFNGAYVNEGSFVIDLNGCSVKFETGGGSDDRGWERCITVCGSGDLRLTDSVGSGIFKGVCSNQAVFAAAEPGGTLVLDSVAVELFSENAQTGARGHCFGSWGGTVTVSGGVYDGDVVAIACGTEQPASLLIENGLFGSKKAKTALYMTGKVNVNVKDGEFSYPTFGVRAAQDADLSGFLIEGGSFRDAALDESGRSLTAFISEESQNRTRKDGVLTVAK